MEHSVTEIFKWIMTTAFAVLIIVIGGLLYHNNLINGYQQQVVQVLERSGGLTEPAAKELADISKKQYKNFFSVTTDSGANTGDTVNYGKDINFEIHTKIPFSKKGTEIATTKYATTSEVRRDSQAYVTNGKTTNVGEAEPHNQAISNTSSNTNTTSQDNK